MVYRRRVALVTRANSGTDFRQAFEQPGRKSPGIRGALGFQLFQLDPAPRVDLQRIRDRNPVEIAEDNVIEFMLHQRFRDLRLVDECENFPEWGADPHFLVQATGGGGQQRVAASRMTAAGVRPESGAVVLAGRPTLQEGSAGAIKKEDAERPVQDAGSMCLQLADCSKGLVALVDEHQLFFRDAHGCTMQPGAPGAT